MVIELSQVLKLLCVVKSHQNNGKSKRQQVKKDFELRKIDRGLEYPVYEENEKFCLQTKIITHENDDLVLTDLGDQILLIDSKEKLNELIIRKCLLKGDFSNKIIPALAQFNVDGNNELWYEKKSIAQLFDSTDFLHILYDVELLIKGETDVRLNSKFHENESIIIQRKKKRKQSQGDIDDSLKIQKEVGQIGEKFVLKFEKNRLKEAGCVDEAEHVDQISEDWANRGYDIESFDGDSPELQPNRFIEVKSSTGKKFSVFWSENEIEVARELGEKYWIYFVSEIDIDNETSPNIPEMIQDPFNRIDPLNINPENTEFDKKWESIHITKKTEEN
jgi:hypothetical protein